MQIYNNTILLLIFLLLTYSATTTPKTTLTISSFVCFQPNYVAKRNTADFIYLYTIYTSKFSYIFLNLCIIERITRFVNTLYL